MTAMKLAAALALGLLLAAAALADGGVLAKAEKDKAAEREVEQKKVAAAHLPKDRKPRAKEEVRKLVEAGGKRAGALAATIRAQAAACAKAGGPDPKAAEEGKRLEAECGRLVTASATLERCAFEEPALEAALATLIHEATALAQTAGDVEEIAFVLDSEELYAAVDALDDALFELDLAVFELDQAVDELDGTIGDDAHADIFVPFEIEVK